MIFGNYGGQQIGQIFKKYFLLTILLQQIMFSFINIPAYQPAVDPLSGENNNISVTMAEIESPGEIFNWIQILQLKMNLAQLEQKKLLTPKEDLNPQ